MAKKENIKIDITEYLLMHNRNNVIKTLKGVGYKGKTDNASLYKALNFYKKKNGAKALRLIADLHPDRELILWSVKNKDVNADGDNESEKSTPDNIPENDNNSNNTFSKIDVKSLLIGTTVAIGLFMAIKFVVAK